MQGKRGHGDEGKDAPPGILEHDDDAGKDVLTPYAENDDGNEVYQHKEEKQQSGDSVEGIKVTLQLVFAGPSPAFYAESIWYRPRLLHCHPSIFSLWASTW